MPSDLIRTLVSKIRLEDDGIIRWEHSEGREEVGHGKKTKKIEND